MPTETEKIHSPNLFYRLFQNSALIVLSLGLLFGGVAILQTQIPFWSLVYGIPAIFLGIITSLITFNEIIKNRIDNSTEYHSVTCRVCGKQSLVPMLTESVVCSDCQYKMALKVQLTALLFLVLLGVPVTLHLSKQIQNIRQNAQTPPLSPFCETGEWYPKNCQCGTWDNEKNCAGNTKRRICGDIDFCCEQTSTGWYCRLVNEP